MTSGERSKKSEYVITLVQVKFQSKPRSEPNKR